MAPSNVAVVGPLPGVGARRLGWDRSGRLAITLTPGNVLLGLSPDAQVWEQAATGTRTMAWPAGAPLLAVVGGDVLVDGGGTVRVHGAIDELALSPSARWVLARSAEGIAALLASDGTIVEQFPAELVRWHPAEDRFVVVDHGRPFVGAPGEPRRGLGIDAEDVADLAWSPSGAHLVLTQPHESFLVVDEEGEVLASLPSHERDPNTTASLGTNVAATAGGDGRVVVHDLVGRSLLAVIQTSGIATWLSLSDDERFLLTASPEFAVWDLSTGQQVGPTRPAVHAAWHPAAAVLACCDGADLWLERYG